MDLREVFEFYKGKKVLVTGHTGFKGAWLCRILIKAGAEVTGYSLEPPTAPDLFSMAGLEGRMDSVIGDIRDLDHLKRTFERRSRSWSCIWQPSPLSGIPIRIRSTPMRPMSWAL